MIKLIEQNLFDFYCAMADAAKIHLYKGKKFCAVSDKEGGWPQLVFDLNYTCEPENLLPELSRAISERKIPPYFIASDKYLDASYEPLMKKLHIYPVTIWDAMYLKMRTAMSLKPLGGVEFREIKSKQDVTSFTRILNHELFASTKLSQAITDRLITYASFRMFGAFIYGEMVSTLLLFRNDKCTGLYFIATDRENRNRGYAGQLISFALNRLYEEGEEEFVLHATSAGSKLYNRIGFQRDGKLNIFWKR